jgi:crossover junction endodeoxyribonuclease RuvC
MIAGIDPGQQGAIAFISAQGDLVEVIEFSRYTEHDIAEELRLSHDYIERAYIEKVASRPGQGVKSTFKFGTNYGFWLGLLTAFRIPYEQIVPRRWQTVMNCLTGGNKNITKAKAQQLYPHERIVHANADAILIAEYGRRMFYKMDGKHGRRQDA